MSKRKKYGPKEDSTTRESGKKMPPSRSAPEPKIAKTSSGTRTGIWLALAAAGVIGTMATIVMKKDEQPKPATPTKPTPVLATKNPETREIRKIKIGPFDLIFDQNYSKEEFERIKKILEMGYKVISKYVPIREDAGRAINVERQTGGISYSFWHEGKFAINPKASDGLIIHEFVHLIHGKRDSNLEFVEEGLGVSISILAAEELGVESWDRIKKMELSKNLLNGGLRTNGRFGNYEPLIVQREYFCAQFWLKIEKAHPGYIRKFHEAYYKFLDEGGRNFDGQKITEIMSSLDPANFERLTAENPMTRPGVIPPHNFLTYIQYIELKEGERWIAINVVKKRPANEIPLSNTPILFQVTNLDTGKISRDLMANTNKDGEIRLNLNHHPGNFSIESEAGSGKHYKITTNVNGEKEELEFTMD